MTSVRRMPAPPHWPSLKTWASAVALTAAFAWGNIARAEVGASAVEAFAGSIRAAAQDIPARVQAWYFRSDPWSRMTWGGLGACALVLLVSGLDRIARLRRGRVIPGGFRQRFLARFAEGRIDWSQGLDYCELNPSPAARVALAALRRHGEAEARLDAAVSAARRKEVETLWRNLLTVRRVGIMSALIGVLGTLTQLTPSLSALPADAPWGPEVSLALRPLIAAVALAILALVAYDGLSGRIDALSRELDRVGSETVEALSLSLAKPRGTASNRLARPTGTHQPAPHVFATPNDSHVHARDASVPHEPDWRAGAS